MIVLALNSGSSSLKFGVFHVRSGEVETLLSGEAELGKPRGVFRAEDAQQKELLCEKAAMPTLQHAIGRISGLLTGCGIPAPEAIGHRLVHGGPELRQHCLLSDDVMKKLDAAISFAPLHIPSALALIRSATQHWPGVPQVACFDTAFHAALPDVARTLPIPRELRAHGIERYGFHGLSCESIVQQLGHHLPSRMVIAHLGNGASITAVKNGCSIDTSMGLTPTGGVIMGTRTGDLDPGVLIHLMRQRNLDAASLEALVDQRSGLLGISGIGSDMRVLRQAASSNVDAQLAIDMFCYSVRKQIGGMIAALNGADRIVFTGGIGENDAETRASICNGLQWQHASVGVLPSKENEEIARHTDVIAASGTTSASRLRALAHR